LVGCVSVYGEHTVTMLPMSLLLLVSWPAGVRATQVTKRADVNRKVSDPSFCRQSVINWVARTPAGHDTFYFEVAFTPNFTGADSFTSIMAVSPTRSAPIQ
jgi:hypothetical protein